MIQWCWLGKEERMHFHQKAEQLGGVKTNEGGPIVKELVGPNDIKCYGWKFPNEQSYELFCEYSRTHDHGLNQSAEMVTMKSGLTIGYMLLRQPVDEEEMEDTL